ncbi:hypothetical protein [Klebsiella pneumoniae]|uniref:hypothetical protein n=1 Tax=Klebsiella pneumoniae TaxID=573 RepID=UPI000B9B0159|nr:hypothetical protein [Klebsiella pneumoniae]MBX4830589.1 hypothetical protein [Klebsiella pneumoniae]HBQ5991069.1 hypothetical protein [Klebsiella pneumoniae subsp. pneumoniae]HBR6772834.1 hypothetical protein [Klebsiella pneumoniae]
MNPVQFYMDALGAAADGLFCLMLIGVGLVVCGLVAEFFAERKASIRHDEVMMSMKLQRQFKE